MAAKRKNFKMKSLGLFKTETVSFFKELLVDMQIITQF